MLLRQQATNHETAHAALTETLRAQMFPCIKIQNEKKIRHQIVQQFRAIGGASVGGLRWLLHTLVPAPYKELGRIFLSSRNENSV